MTEIAENPAGLKQPSARQKAALFEFRRRIRTNPDRFSPKQSMAEKELSRRWGIAESVGEFGPEPPIGFKSPRPEYKPNLFGGVVGTPISGSLEEFQKAAGTALTKDKTGRVLTQFGLGTASGLTGGATELGLKLRATPSEAKKFEPSGFAEKASRGVGELVGFMGGAPLKLSTALVRKILPQVAKETIKRKAVREAATLGLAELIGNNEQLADVIKQPSYQAGVTALGNRLTSAAAGALTGAQFGLVREKLSKFTSRALANVILSNALHETMSGTERPTEDVIYDSLLSILFSRKGVEPTKKLKTGEVRELKPSEIEIITPEIEAELRGFAKIVAPEVKDYLPPITKTTTAAVNQPRGDYVGEIPEVRVPRSGHPADRPLPPIEQAPAVVPPQPKVEAKTPEQIIQERKQKIVDEHLALKERKLEFAKQQQAKKERIIAEKTAEREEKRREALAKKFEESGKFTKITTEKNKKEISKLQKVVPAKEQKIEEAPTIFYRGTVKGETARIPSLYRAAEGKAFVARSEESARFYGEDIEKFESKPDTKVLYEGTPEFGTITGRKLYDPEIDITNQLRKGEVLNSVINDAIQKAKGAGYDAISFKRDSDIGTIILNENAFKRSKVEEAPIIAETKPITGTEPLGQPPTGETAITEEGKEPVAARPTEETFRRNVSPKMPSGEFNPYLDPKIDIKTVKSHAESGIKEAQDALPIREAKPQVTSEIESRKAISPGVRNELTKNIADLGQKIEKERRLNGETDRYRRLINERDRIQNVLEKAEKK